MPVEVGTQIERLKSLRKKLKASRSEAKYSKSRNQFYARMGDRRIWRGITERVEDRLVEIDEMLDDVPIGDRENPKLLRAYTKCRRSIEKYYRVRRPPPRVISVEEEKPIVIVYKQAVRRQQPVTRVNAIDVDAPCTEEPIDTTPGPARKLPWTMPVFRKAFTSVLSGKGLANALAQRQKPEVTTSSSSEDDREFSPDVSVHGDEDEEFFL